jgi:hypothetical protein
MPARPWVLAIVIFWVVTTGWLFYRDFWPSLRPGEPPPYTIDLVDEARRVPISWTVYRGEESNEQKVGSASTSVQYHPEDDTFDLYGSLLYPKPVPGVERLMLIMESVYRVTRDGELKHVRANMTVVIRALKDEIRVRGQIEGPVRDGRFVPEGHIAFPGGEQPLVIEPVSVEGRGNVLNPQHPLNRILDLRPGQHWRVPLFDPVALALSRASAGANADPVVELVVAALAGSNRTAAGFRVLEARVVPQPQTLDWFGRDETCLVIEYQGQDTKARTWVRESDGLVLQQEATVLGDRLVLKRNP